MSRRVCAPAQAQTRNSLAQALVECQDQAGGEGLRVAWRKPPALDAELEAQDPALAKVRARGGPATEPEARWGRSAKIELKIASKMK